MEKRIKPISKMTKIEEEIKKIVGEVLYQKKELLGLDERWNPCLDISEKGNEITVEVELPGVAQKDVTLLLHSNRLEIKGTKRENLPQGQIKYVRLEREYGPFRRFVFLPETIVPEKAHASLENGVLRISLRKYKQKGEKEGILKIEESKE
mgnify:CR=1 FL=1